LLTDPPGARDPVVVVPTVVRPEEGASVPAPQHSEDVPAVVVECRVPQIAGGTNLVLSGGGIPSIRRNVVDLRDPVESEVRPRTGAFDKGSALQQPPRSRADIEG